ncbi:thioredoxin [Cylindrospermum stagnale PCC 7417]|uniref:Thioredoxin n=1 Tax=Cylindrospermum stagnale PCC 7417 TaxID=56107 RepID=K9WXN1_9NOST|nr:thioredoxin [Cylindrospermum stagnale]AFZ24559.1 thioredoxin [Cylindrospermum stagnale PCC 7417]
MTTVSQIEDSEFDVLLESEPIFVVDFTAPWCGPCRKITPLIEQLADAYQGRVKVLKIDIDKNKIAARKYGVKSIPAVLIFKDGEVVENIVGVVPYENFVTAVEKHV